MPARDQRLGDVPLITIVTSGPYRLLHAWTLETQKMQPIPILQYSKLCTLLVAYN